MRKRIDFRVVGAALAVLALAGVVLSRLDVFRSGVLRRAQTSQESSARDDPAPEFAGIAAWINSPALTIGALRGHVVLVDFWTYSCINCVRNLPATKQLYERYHAAGLEVVGVHSPEFTFEKSEANVRRAVERLGVPWPVGLDNDMKTWRAYRNNYWPHAYLIDRNGRIRFDHIGEGGHEIIEAKVRQLLGGALPSAASMPDVDLPSELTPEIYLGYGRGEVQGTVANPGGYTEDAPHRYGAPAAAQVEDAGTSGSVFLAGTWTAHEEEIVAAEPGARIILPFRAREVYVVAAGLGRFDVLLDGAPIPARRAGEAVTGGGIVVDRSDLFHLAHLGGLEQHVLTLVARDAGLQAFTFTFG